MVFIGYSFLGYLKFRFSICNDRHDSKNDDDKYKTFDHCLLKRGQAMRVDVCCVLDQPFADFAHAFAFLILTHGYSFLSNSLHPVQGIS